MFCHETIEIENSTGGATQSLLVSTHNAYSSKINRFGRESMSSLEILNNKEFAQLQSGNKTVFKKIYQVYFGLIQYVVKRCGISDEDSLDIVQDTFFKLYEKSSSLKNKDAIKSWLVTTARNQAMDLLRKHKLQQKHVETGYAGQESVCPSLMSDNQVHELELLLLGEFIDQVERETDDNTFTLFYRHGLSVKEIAIQLNVPVSTVTNRLSRMRKSFKDRIKTHITQLHDMVY